MCQPREMIYSIVNAFLNKITFHNEKAEEILRAALKDETSLPPSIHHRIEEVFEPVFFNYPNGTGARSVWEPRDTSKYILQWRRLASMREWLKPNAAATELSKEFSRDEVTQIFRTYME